jgi:LysR family transcriptional regulator (chromosome initiation inhibitor)
MLDSKHLHTLAAVISEQSFEKAAKSLFLTQSAVSQRIRQLEETVGQMLVVRSSPVRPTPAGMAVLRHYRQLKVLEEGLFEELVPVDTADFVTVSLAVNADSLDTWFLEAVREISRRERVVLDLVVDDQTVTHEYLRSGEVQGAITSAPAGFQGLKTHVLERWSICASRRRNLPGGILPGDSTSRQPVPPRASSSTTAIGCITTFSQAVSGSRRPARPCTPCPPPPASCGPFSTQLPTAWSRESWPRSI